MDTQVAAKTKRSRKPKAEAAVAEPPKSWRERMAEVDARAAATRAAVAKEYEERGYGPVPRTSIRWIGNRSKGKPYSRMILADTTPAGGPGHPALLHLKHPTKGHTRTVPATLDTLPVFFPNLPGDLALAMLGHR